MNILKCTLIIIAAICLPLGLAASGRGAPVAACCGHAKMKNKNAHVPCGYVAENISKFPHTHCFDADRRPGETLSETVKRLQK